MYFGSTCTWNWNFCKCYKNYAEILKGLNILTSKSRRGPLSASTIKTKQKGGDTQSQDKAELLERKRALKAELTSTSTAIGHIEQDMDRLQTYINNTGL